MLIKNAEVYQTGVSDLRIKQGMIADIGTLTPCPGEPVVEAFGGALLPGLNDHHIHFLSYAASLTSIDCSPAAVNNSEGLALLLQEQALGEEWLRGVGYHESVAGEIDSHWIDKHCPDRPVRIQHRTGRLWIFNSAGLAILKRAAAQQEAPPLLPAEGFTSGRFYDASNALACLLGRQLPPVNLASKMLATYGITGFSDMTPSNDKKIFELFQRMKQDNKILQDYLLASKSTGESGSILRCVSGPVKIHLHENHLPPLQELVDTIKKSHQAGSAVAIHCVTEIELLFSLTALEEAGSITADRIEHAAVTPEYLLEKIQTLGVTVVTQPHFILEKGDTYLADIDTVEHAALYRCRSFLNADIPLAGSSDAPFGGADPWIAMRAAVDRRTSSGNIIGRDESLTPEQALALYMGSLQTPSQPRKIQAGMPADLCLLKYPWRVARTRLTSNDVQLVTSKGKPIYTSPKEPLAIANI